MTQNNTLNVKLSNSQLKKLKSAIKNVTKVTLNLSSNFIESSNDETNFSHKLLLTNTQVSKIRKPFTNGSSANIFNFQLSKIVQSGEVLCDIPNFVNILSSVTKKRADIVQKIREKILDKEIDRFNK